MGYIAKMDKLLAEKRQNGTMGICLSVHDSKDLSANDVAFDFCKMEEARAENQTSRIEDFGF